MSSVQKVWQEEDQNLPSEYLSSSVGPGSLVLWYLMSVVERIFSFVFWFKFSGGATPSEPKPGLNAMFLGGAGGAAATKTKTTS